MLVVVRTKMKVMIVFLSCCLGFGVGGEGFGSSKNPIGLGCGIDKSLVRAVEIAKKRAELKSRGLCWRYVKQALLQAGAVESYPKTAYAKQAGSELKRHGFDLTPIKDPYQAPEGAVLVYGGKGAGHVELRTENGFVSDFFGNRPSKRPLLGVYVKR